VEAQIPGIIEGAALKSEDDIFLAIASGTDQTVLKKEKWFLTMYN
jgi:hypothetical protein